MLHVGVPLDHSPLAFTGQDQAIVGSEAAFATLISRKLGITVQLEGMRSAELERALRQGRIDAVAMQSPQTLNKDHYQFTQPYMDLTYAIFTDSNDASISDLSSLEGKRMALLDGDHYQYDLLESVDNDDPGPGTFGGGRGVTR